MAILHAFYESQSPQEACLFVCLSQIGTTICSQRIFHSFSIFVLHTHWPTDQTFPFTCPPSSSVWAAVVVNLDSVFRQRISYFWWKCVCWLTAEGHRVLTLRLNLLSRACLNWCSLSAEAAVLPHDNQVLFAQVRDVVVSAKYLNLLDLFPPTGKKISITLQEISFFFQLQLK